MNYCIAIENGLPVGHPIRYLNLVQSFPGIDINNLPNTFAECVVTDKPVAGVYQVVTDDCTYDLVDGRFQTVWAVRNMTAKEKTVKQNTVKANFPSYFASWTFNTATCDFDPPTPMPTDGKFYEWIEDTKSWTSSK